MIEGIGVDLVEVGRIRDTIETWGGRFLEKIFTEAEIRYCTSKKSSYQHFAARFAAKEAVAKALAIGWSGGFRWKDVEVVNDESGKPSIVLTGHVKNLMSRSRIFLSISHTRELVVAFAVIGRTQD
ncbi:MAG: holo-ACP synthase [Bacteroidota bacterium]|jgi:holo-[acyl-carrier protein] synthase